MYFSNTWSPTTGRIMDTTTPPMMRICREDDSSCGTLRLAAVFLTKRKRLNGTNELSKVARTAPLCVAFGNLISSRFTRPSGGSNACVRLSLRYPPIEHHSHCAIPCALKDEIFLDTT